MYTPNGRFKTGQRLCLSNSDFHPESWNPVWGVSTILLGLYSFMLDDQPTLGSVTSTAAQKRRFAAESLAFNCQNKVRMRQHGYARVCSFKKQGISHCAHACFTVCLSMLDALSYPCRRTSS